MVRRRSTVRFRNGAPAHALFRTPLFQDPETKIQDQETNVATDRARRPDAAGQTRPSSLRVSPGQTLRVSVARRIGPVVSEFSRSAAISTPRSTRTSAASSHPSDTPERLHDNQHRRRHHPLRGGRPVARFVLRHEHGHAGADRLRGRSILDGGRQGRLPHDGRHVRRHDGDQFLCRRHHADRHPDVALQRRVHCRTRVN